ncbi:uncharacterized protein (DUF58 family) [Paenibacillus endophyticus]|uniref:Uncharacterized protein (DUF58 family) n=1 Tax=Paenibacillus endophyticus TaxID=1294268 RepID=A0A7W5C9Q2_9BACL|nr:DUF58 domain-containing protein [Paenibacillus endophyticus]MBB3153722.1 uncharacterized protein (DUF58 family) [Paenibacillus endophyticus]
MNAPHQDDVLQIVDRQIDDVDGIKPQAEIQKEKLKGDRQMPKAQQSAAYRTRWFAWSLIAAAWAGSMAAVVLRGGAVEWFMTAVLSMIIVVSGLAPLLAAARLSAIRDLSQQTIREGGQLAIRFTLKRAIPVPFVWIAIHEETLNESSALNRKISIHAVFTPVWSKETTYLYTLHQLRRGRHPYQHAVVTIGDWLGLTAISRQLDCRSEFIVLPGLAHAASPNRPERLEGGGVYAVPSSLRGESQDLRGEAGREEIEAAVRAAGLGPDFRPFRQGDSLRHLDWRSAAKGRGLQTKVHSLEQPVQTCIAIDTMAAAYDADDRLFDACVGWAALALANAAELGNGVTLLLGEGSQTMRLPHQSGTQQGVSGMLHAMALLRAEGKGSLARSLNRSSHLLARGSTILVFTADWRGGRSWGELAGYAAEKGCRLELFIVTRSNIPTFAMREQHKWLESGGVKLTWLPVPASMSAQPYAAEGGDAHEYA